MIPDPPVQRGPRTEVGVQVLNFFHKMRQTGELPDKTKWKKMVESVDRIDNALTQLENIQFTLALLTTRLDSIERRLLKAENQIAYLLDHIA